MNIFFHMFKWCVHPSLWMMKQYEAIWTHETSTASILCRSSCRSCARRVRRVRPLPWTPLQRGLGLEWCCMSVRCSAARSCILAQEEKSTTFSAWNLWGKTCFYGKNLGPRYWSCFICAWVEIGNRCARCSIFMAMYGHVMWESSFQLLR